MSSSSDGCCILGDASDLDEEPDGSDCEMVSRGDRGGDDQSSVARFSGKSSDSSVCQLVRDSSPERWGACDLLATELGSAASSSRCPSRCSSPGPSLPEDFAGPRSSAPVGTKEAESLRSPWVAQYVGRGAKFLQPQAQVLVTQAVLSFRRVSPKVLKPLLLALGRHGCTRNFAEHAAGAVLGIGHTMARNCFERVRSNGMAPAAAGQPGRKRCRPVHPQQRAKRRRTRPGAPEDRPGEALVESWKVRVRECLAVSFYGLADVEYQRRMRRMLLGNPLVGQRFCSKAVVPVVERVAWEAARTLRSAALARELPGLGIPSDLSLIWDGVSIGATSFSRQETLMLIGCTSVQPDSGAIEPHLVAAPSISLNHSGEGQVELLLRELGRDPWSLDRHALRRRLAVLAADGAGVQGGEDARHSSTGAGEKLWHLVFPDSPQQAIGAEWDAFHRLDIATRRAIAKIPAAVEVFDITKVMSTLFGIGDGRAVLRGVAAAMALPSRRVADTGGTRKVVALSQSVANLLQNFDAYVAGMHARRGLVQARKSSQRMGALVDAGRRLTSMNFVSFALVLRDALRLHVAPLCLLSESGRAEATEVWTKIERTCDELDRMGQSLDVIRRWVAVASATLSYLSAKDSREFLRAVVYTPAGRACPGFAGALSSLMLRRKFKHSELLVDGAVADPAAFMTLAPRCQCASMRTPPGHGPRLAACAFRRSSGGARAARVPEWVAHGGDAIRAEARQPSSLLDAPLRYQIVPRSSPAPPQLRGVPRFRTAPHPVRCQVPSWWPAVRAQIDEGLRACKQFVLALRQEILDYNGTVGVNAHMRTVVPSAAKCFDWQYLACRRPRQEHAEAFVRLYKALLPSLVHTAWPSGGHFAHVERAWPSARQCFAQYTLLLQRVRRRAEQDFASGRPSLFQACAYWVRPASVRPALAAVSTRPLVNLRGPLVIISDFLGVRQGFFQRPFLVKIASLRGVREAGRRCPMPELTKGALVSLASPPFVGRWVRIAAAKWEVRGSEVAALLCTDALLCAEENGQHCWHAARLAHRARLLRGPESACERWGSFLHNLWSPTQGLPPWRMSARLMLRESGLDGGGSVQEEELITEIAALLAADGGRRTMVTSGSRGNMHCRRDGAVPIDFAIVRTWAMRNRPQLMRGRLADCAAYTPAERASHQPAELPAVAREEVDRHVRRIQGGGMLIRSLPQFQVDTRTARKSLAPSALRCRLQQWLVSQDAEEWRASRKQLFGAGANGDAEEQRAQ